MGIKPFPLPASCVRPGPDPLVKVYELTSACVVNNEAFLWGGAASGGGGGTLEEVFGAEMGGGGGPEGAFGIEESGGGGGGVGGVGLGAVAFWDDLMGIEAGGDDGGAGGGGVGAVDGREKALRAACSARLFDKPLVGGIGGAGGVAFGKGGRGAD